MSMGWMKWVALALVVVFLPQSAVARTDVIGSRSQDGLAGDVVGTSNEPSAIDCDPQAPTIDPRGQRRSGNAAADGYTRGEACTTATARVPPCSGDLYVEPCSCVLDEEGDPPWSCTVNWTCIPSRSDALSRCRVCTPTAQ